MDACLCEPDSTAVNWKRDEYKLWRIELNCRRADKISDRKEKKATPNIRKSNRLK